jgi:hypothetical protein
MLRSSFRHSRNRLLARSVEHGARDCLKRRSSGGHSSTGVALPVGAVFRGYAASPRTGHARAVLKNQKSHVCIQHAVGFESGAHLPKAGSFRTTGSIGGGPDHSVASGIQSPGRKIRRLLSRIQKKDLVLSCRQPFHVIFCQGTDLYRSHWRP